MKDKSEEEEEEEQKPPLARWVDIVQPAGLSTKPGKQRFAVTIKLPEKSPTTAAKFVKEMNDALKFKVDTTRGCKLTAHFVLVDSERTRLQRATASFPTFEEANTCLSFLKELGLPTNDISPELEDFGNKKYDPWFRSISQSWWPWFAEWRNPPPEMPMMKVTNRLDVSEGGKYKEGTSGKLGKSDEVDRADAHADAQDDESESGGKKRPKNKPRQDDTEAEAKPRRKKKRRDEDGRTP